MDTSFLAQQVNSSIGQLHGLFDEIGVPTHERETRESEVCLDLLVRHRCGTSCNLIADKLVIV